MLRGLAAFFALSVMLCSWAPAMEFSAHPNTSKRLTAILAEGEILKGDLDRFKKYVAAQPVRPVIAIYLASPGGSLGEGMAFGRFFRLHAIKTVVEGGETCASACALAFLGGHDGTGVWRSSSDNSKLGFHSFRSPDSPLQDQDDTLHAASQVMAYGKSVDAPLELLIRTFETPSDEMHWLSEEETCSLGIKLWSNYTHRWICE